MRYTAGRTFQTSHETWERFEITIEDVDFHRMVIEYDLPAVSLTNSQVFFLMELQYNLVEAMELGKRGYIDTAEAHQRISRTKQSIQKIVDKVKSAG